MALSKAQVAQIRKDLDAAFAAVTAKHGVTFSIGTIRFSDVQMSGKLTGVVQQVANGVAVTVAPEMVALQRRGAHLLGANYAEGKLYYSPTLGKIEVVGYNSKAHKYPFIVKQVNTGKRYKVSTMSLKQNVLNGAV